MVENLGPYRARKNARARIIIGIHLSRFVVPASSVSLVSPQAGKLIHSAARSGPSVPVRRLSASFCHALHPPRRVLSRPTLQNTFRRAVYRRPVFCAAPVLVPCSRVLSASFCHASLASRPGRLPSVSGWSSGRPAALRSSSLRSIRPCSAAQRFLFSGALCAAPLRKSPTNGRQVIGAV